MSKANLLECDICKRIENESLRVEDVNGFGKTGSHRAMYALSGLKSLYTHNMYSDYMTRKYEDMDANKSAVWAENLVDVRSICADCMEEMEELSFVMTSKCLEILRGYKRNSDSELASKLRGDKNF
jgi:hypothetical protein